MKQSKVYIYGKHALIEALTHAPNSIKKVYLSEKVDDGKLLSLINRSNIPTAVLEPHVERSLERGATHQGVIGVLSPESLLITFDQFMEKITITPNTAILLLGEVQDPHNVGAVIRSAAAFGIAGVFMPEHKQAGITGAVVKVSAGMAFRVPLVTIGNVNQAVRDLKDAGFTVYGLEGGNATSVTEESFSSPSVFILGNEGAGIREKTRDLCDTMLSIPIHQRCESLNAAVSAAVALYAWSSKHPEALSWKKK